MNHLQKTYNSRSELMDDIYFIRNILSPIDYEKANHLMRELFERWMITSSDSPWYVYTDDEINVAEQLIKLSSKKVYFNDNPNVKKYSIRSKHYNLRNLK